MQGTTRAAVIRLQLEHRLIRSSRDVSAGVIGPRTRAVLLKKLTHSDVDLGVAPTSQPDTHSLLMDHN